MEKKKTKKTLEYQKTCVAVWDICLQVEFEDNKIVFEHMSGGRKFGLKKEAQRWIDFHCPGHPGLKWFPRRYVLLPRKVGHVLKRKIK